MLSYRRKSSVDDGARESGASGSPGSGPKSRAQNALLKLSAANAFAKAHLGSSRGAAADIAAHSLTYETGVQASSGSLFLPDDCGLSEPASPHVPRGPYWGMYAEYEDVMDLLHTAVIADGSSRSLLSGVPPDRLVHVAHLGLGACCSVDLVAVHCANGSRLLSAAKSCYLPPSDPRMRASMREAELLRLCADCPFIMQLLAVVVDTSLAERPPTTTAATGMAPLSPPLLSNAHSFTNNNAVSLGGGSAFGNAAAAAAWGNAGDGYGHGYGNAEGYGSPVILSRQGSVGGIPCNRSFELDGPGGGGGGGVSRAAMGAHQGLSSPGYQAWAAWRGGGGAGDHDLEWQIRVRMAAAASSSLPGGSSSRAEYGNSYNMQYGNGFGRMDTLARSSLGGYDDSLSAVPGTGVGLGMGFQGGCEVLGGSPPSGGGGMCGGGVWGQGGSSTGSDGWVQQHPLSPGQPRLFRRNSIEVVNMYGGCEGMGMAVAAARGGSLPLGGGEAGGDGQSAAAPGEQPVMCTLLLGWARCGDLRRLVQLALSRSAAHQVDKHTGASPAVPGLPPLVPEDAARFYTGCLVLALEHLHTKLNTVHRDLKLANLLLLANGYAIVGDLGTAVELGTVPGGKLVSRVGSPGHMSPECRDRDPAGYDTSADIWSAGACLFALLTGVLPAGTAGPPNRSWTPPLSKHWSRELQDLLGRMLAWAPSQRPTVAQLMRDPWFRGFSWRALREQKMTPPSSTPWRELLWYPKESRKLL